MTHHIGILTSGGDCPGLNAAIRGVVRAGREQHGMCFLGFRDGFRGLVQNRTMDLDPRLLSGILTDGGTILGTSRDKPHKMTIGDKTRDMTEAAVDTYRRHHLDALVCLGGGGTQKNARRLQKEGLNVISLPKTIDNDVAGTDVSFGFDTALGIATEAIDRLHSTATSHHRIIVVELMGHRAGWLALGAGIAGGADVILLPEIPYDLEKVAQAIRDRTRAGKRFSIVAVAEGAMSREQADTVENLLKKKKEADRKSDRQKYSGKLAEFHEEHLNHTVILTRELERLTQQESRLTILGHLQRGGTPSAGDRVLATRLGTACARALADERYGVMIAARGRGAEPVDLEEVAGKKKLVPPDHPWVTAARDVGTCFGD
ncbi:6-phosphofructokinase [Kiritimatiella glycovorans]|uniref:ATP-dependent 6-phosphofructokinase n=1 Tax=Kiritimatiella glycovorans TaxID=1307763 RepID=A0A0G3EK45_9BACT|nr:ATP-dependent 6-phosphofructokinase [Kiritimatiella glycovorans]AKJ64519.1 6-phosphofructokinase 1 [Kiritimatiella glycovorans]